MSGRGAERILDALEWFATTTAPVTYTEFVLALDVPKSSGLLLLKLLVKRNYVERLPDNRYRLVRLPGESVEGAASWGTLVRLADRHLSEAVASVGESGFIAVLEAGRIRYLNKILPQREIRYDRDITPTRLPHQVASGQVFLADFGPAALDEYGQEVGLSDAEQASLEALLEVVRRDGVAVNLNGIVEGAAGAAAAVRDADGRVIAAVNISGPRERFLANLDAVKAAVVSVGRVVTAEVAHRTRKSM